MSILPIHDLKPLLNQFKVLQWRAKLEQLKFLGMPVLKAKGEIEALCARLNGDNHVDVCNTFDSDANLFEAKCVIKTFRSNSKEPFEWYYMSDIEAGIGLKRNHLIAPSLLAENDHDLNGVQGIGLDTTLCFGQTFSEDEINRLGEIGSGDASVFKVVCNLWTIVYPIWMRAH